MLKRTQPFGVTPGKVSVIPSTSTELASGQVKYEKAKQPRLRLWRVARSRPEAGRN